MDAQIIISREDNTDFISLGFIQTDTSLVSALGGALANFAEEIGLAGEQETPEANANAINFSSFPNGILASKMVKVKDHSPIILIAIKGFEGQDKDLEFIVDYAEKLAESIVISFEDQYTSIGLIPKVDEAFANVAAVANTIYKKHNDKIRKISKDVKSKIPKLLEELWQEQNLFEIWSQEYVNKRIAYMSPSEVSVELAKYFYLLCTKSDALLPLVLGSDANPLNEVAKIVDQFLKKKTAIARKEINNEITKIIQQLNDSSKALSTRELMEIPDVELINESFLFEKILVTKTTQLDSVVKKLLADTNQDLYRKLFKKYPLKFISMSKDVVFEKDELDKVVSKIIGEKFKAEIADKKWITLKISKLLRQVSSKYKPNEIVKKQKEILNKTYDEFISSIKKEHPFLLIADPSLKALSSAIKSDAEKLLDRFSTTLDEAVILYNSIGQVHSNISKDKSATPQDLMMLFFLQQVIQPYQFRDVPDIVYALIADCLSQSSYGKKSKPEELLEENMTEFEKKLNFKVATETKKVVLKRTAKAKATRQSFENFEDLAYFFKSFRAALELTITKIIQKIFGPEKFPLPPVKMMKFIQKISTDIQSVCIIKQVIEKISKRPGGRELFSSSTTNFVRKNTKFKVILPTAPHLAKFAFEDGWIKPLKKKKKPRTPIKEILKMDVTIPSLKCEGVVSDLLKKPFILEELWVKFGSKAIEARQPLLKARISEVEDQMKVSAGKTSGKKKFSSTIKRLKSINRWLNGVVSGGGFMRKIFSGGELQQLISDASKDIDKNLRYHPEKYSVVMDNQTINSIVNTNPIDGDFQDLIQIYSSVWVADSQYIENIADNLFWAGLTKGNNIGISTQLQKKITQNLLNSYKKNKATDKNEVIRETIIEEIVPAFNKIVRTALTDAFSIFNTNRVVQFATKGNDWYVSLGKLRLDKKLAEKVFKTLENVSIKDLQSGYVEVRLNLTEYYSLKRSKESQTLEEFIRKAAYYNLNKRELKALEYFSDLNDRYIGKSAADTLYSYIRSLAQILITPVE